MTWYDLLGKRTQMWYCEFHRPDSRSLQGEVRTEFWRSYSWPWSWWHHCCGGSEQAQLGRRGGHYCAQWKRCLSNPDAAGYQLNLYNVLLLLTEKLWIRQTKNRSFQVYRNKEVLKVKFLRSFFETNCPLWVNVYSKIRSRKIPFWFDFPSQVIKNKASF